MFDSPPTKGWLGPAWGEVAIGFVLTSFNRCRPLLDLDGSEFSVVRADTVSDLFLGAIARAPAGLADEVQHDQQVVEPDGEAALAPEVAP